MEKVYRLDRCRDHVKAGKERQKAPKGRWKTMVLTNRPGRGNAPANG
ncbi:MAG: hypothetical protein K6B13_08035 [Prevotella sp.]|nr:hypothetical protein [Prevotella sp.]